MDQQKACVIFNQLVVTNIEDSSGIFIGTNQAIGWTSYSKSNQGFGSLSNATLSHAVSVVQDPDLLDTPIEDTRSIILGETGHLLQQCAIDFGAIHAYSVSNGSAIDLGDNKQPGWRSSRKVNYGFGKNYGRNHMKQVASIVMDDDAIDASFRNQATILDTDRTAERTIRITQKQENARQTCSPEAQDLDDNAVT